MDKLNRYDRFLMTLWAGLFLLDIWLIWDHIPDAIQGPNMIWETLIVLIYWVCAAYWMMETAGLWGKRNA